MKRLLPLLLVAAAAGCGDDATPAPTPEAAAPCGELEYQLADGSCAPAGIPPDLACPPGEWQRDDGSCVPAGVPPDGCGQGFEHDGDRSCAAVLPADDCLAGQIAVPGDSSCREVMPCGSGTWGDIPVESDTQYVDASFTGASDGSSGAPWTQVAEGIAAAAPGAIVAIAAGRYQEDLQLSGKAVRLWGRCPAMVELAGSGNAIATIDAINGSAGSEIRGVALTGLAIGFAMTGTSVLLEQVWIHHNGFSGIEVVPDFGLSSVTIVDSLIEDNRVYGVFIDGSGAVVERSLIRKTRVDAGGAFGTGVTVRANLDGLGEPALELRGSLVSDNHQAGVIVDGSEALIESTLIKDTMPNDQIASARGLAVQRDPTLELSGRVLLERSVVSNNEGVGIVASGSELTIDQSVVEDTQVNANLVLGRGIIVRSAEGDGTRANVDLRRSVVQRNTGLGIHLDSSDLAVDGSLIRSTKLNPLQFGGWGMMAQAALTRIASTVSVVDSLIDDSQEVGLAVLDSTATVERSLFRNTRVRVHSDGREVGGDAIVNWILHGSSSVTVTATRFEQSASAAVANHGSHVAIGSSELICQLFDLVDEEALQQQASFEDLGGVLCGCPQATAACERVATSAAAPEAVGGLE